MYVCMYICLYICVYVCREKKILSLKEELNKATGTMVGHGLVHMYVQIILSKRELVST